MKLPDKLYVYWSSDNPPCLLAFASVAEIPADENGVRVGIYKLVDDGKFKVQTFLQRRVKKG